MSKMLESFSPDADGFQFMWIILVVFMIGLGFSIERVVYIMLKSSSGRARFLADFGKLISGIKWYYATTVDTKTAKKLEQQGKATLDFSKTYNASVQMTVEKIGPVEDGRCVAVFSCKNGLHELTAIRDATADIVFSRMSGIRVPKESIHLDADGNAFVYVLLGMQAEKAEVTILSESGEYYLVRSESPKLTVGAMVIERANDVTDGKVVVS